MVKSIEQLLCDSERQELFKSQQFMTEKEKEQFPAVAPCDKQMASDRNQDSVGEGVDSVFWEMKTLLWGNR